MAAKLLEASDEGVALVERWQWHWQLLVGSLGSGGVAMGVGTEVVATAAAAWSLGIAEKKPEELKHIATIEPPVVPGEGDKSLENSVCFGCREPLGESTYFSIDFGLMVNIPPATYANGHDVGDFFIAVHRCAMERWYEIIEAKDLDEKRDDDLAYINLITLVIQKNEGGEMKKIKHFSHAHDLILSDNFMDGDKTCDGCMLLISTSFYYCSSFCDFYLHKTCAESLTQEEVALVSCTSTRTHPCCRLHFQMQILRIGYRIKHPGHVHSLFFLLEVNGNCKACGEFRENLYRCRRCDFNMAGSCTSLPLTVRDSKLCEDLALECADSTCNYTVHWECVKPAGFTFKRPVALYKTQADC
ncbi:hypothetical protein F3Y22_tig00116970pilonHSYRG00275 [Hibiscus syriacus]|uniref:DC1 domain-containing protein n=1 Tax=Hibiscus syriacus TaxID=106335 RepID=A0A6A2X9H7_HIBSY|nr:hypothetical protein F3Y22_tig00116970pilonHSYRG00275 [Hibiscus syriacus]